MLEATPPLRCRARSGEVENRAGCSPAQHRSVGQGQGRVARTGPMPLSGSMSRLAQKVCVCGDGSSGQDQAGQDGCLGGQDGDPAGIAVSVTRITPVPY